MMTSLGSPGPWLPMIRKTPFGWLLLALDVLDLSIYPIAKILICLWVPNVLFMTL
jgi:hypothetical protein